MTIKYKSLIVMTVILSVGGIAFRSVSAQETTSVRREVMQRLNAIKPKNTKEFVYQVKVPAKPIAPPSSLRLDLVYKIGHYEWDLVALRIERMDGSPYVNISQVVFSSALGFIKEDTKKDDTYSVRSGQLRVDDFDRLLALAYTLYQSNIEKKYIGPSDQMSYSMTGSSGDGTILLQLTDTLAPLRTVIRESGTLHTGELSVRAQSDYENVRVHLFWAVFYEYLRAHSILNEMDKRQAVDLLMSRLNEPPMADDYSDYFRQALYVQTLGELGSAREIQSLEAAAQNSSLEEQWKNFLKEDVTKAIEKINARSKSQ